MVVIYSGAVKTIAKMGPLTFFKGQMRAMAFAFASFANGGVLSVADYVAGINLFGDASQVPAIMTYGVMLLCGEILSIIDCFICKDVPFGAGAK